MSAFFRNVILALITLVLLALAFYLVLWVLAAIGIALPAIVLTCLKVLLVLVAILFLYDLFFGGRKWFTWP